MSTEQTKTRPPFWNILKILLALLLVGYVLSRTDFDQLPALLGDLSIAWLAVCAILFLSLTLLKAVQYYILMKEHVTYPQVLNVVVWQNAVANYLATGAGVASNITLLHLEHDVEVGRAVTTFLLTKMGDLIALWLAFLVSTVWLWPQFAAIHGAAVGLLLAIGLVILMFFLPLIFRQRFVGSINLILNQLRLSKTNMFQKGLGILQTFSEIDQRRLFGILARVILLSFAYLALSMAWYYSTFKVFNFNLALPTIIFVNVLLQLISYFPIQVFGGLGVSETGSLYLWGLFGVSQPALAPILIGSRVLFYLLNLLPLIYLPVYAMVFEKRESHTH